MSPIKQRYKHHRNLNRSWYRYYKKILIEREQREFRQSGKTLEEYIHDWLNGFKENDNA